MPFEIRGEKRLDAIVNVRLTVEEKEVLREDADIAGLSVSELVRRRYFGRPISASVDRAMIKELRRVAGLAARVHNESGGAYSGVTASVLLDVKRAIERIARESDEHKKNQKS
ncbi:plasmid mobilization protein [Paraburkholderia phenazinium]|uniref:Ribbon-helix-helix protein, copG family n=1 Tax=Paraburkholderia phenazinium TaxID=60549 RepID=A0A1N6KYE8_9BURK|nr:MobB mobilization protein [Paraburkholderia phenazinium]SIO61568.1 hypothetical protein SAMN05444165_5272 [Paraburkholderia phenazinium]